MAGFIMRGHFLYYFIYGLLIIFFCYFYTAIVFNPTDVAENMKKYGGFIPGVRPGTPTADYLDFVMTRITLAGAVFICAIAIMPDAIMAAFRVPYLVASFFGGTGVLIMVGVMLDTMKQIESHLLTRHYDGFMKSGHLKVGDEACFIRSARCRKRDAGESFEEGLGVGARFDWGYFARGNETGNALRARGQKIC